MEYHFLDRVCEGKHCYEFLQLYLLPETTEKVKRENARVLRKAEDIIKERTEALISYNAEQLSTDLSSPIAIATGYEMVVGVL